MDDGWQDPVTSATKISSIAQIKVQVLPGHSSRGPIIRYFLFIGGSSMKLTHIPLGFTWAAFFTIVIFILISYATALATSCASEMTADSMLGL